MESTKVIFIISIISMIISFGISIVVSFNIVDKRISKKQVVYYLSKIATVKNIIKINHNSKIFHNFNSEGNLEGITTKYNRLLNLTNGNECKKGYKKCGILDTLGNLLCIDNNFDCPINDLNVDLFQNKNNYTKKGYKEIYNENLIYNYKFYYSNESLDGNAIVSLLFSDERPRYITMDNFIIDVAAFKDYYDSDLEVKNDNNDRINKGIEFGENLVNIFVSDFSVESIIKASFSLISLIIDADNDKEEFKDYVQEKIENEENELDKYYKNVGENAYIKNYIGFKNLDDINTFMNFDYKIYEDIYPTKTARDIGIANGVLQIIFIFPSFFIAYKSFKYAKKYHEDKEIYKNNNNSNDNTDEIIIQPEKMIGNNNEVEKNKEISDKNAETPETNKVSEISAKEAENIQLDKKNKKYIFLQVIATLFVIGLNIGFISYTGWSLHKNHKNQSKIKKLNRIESDDFVKGFLKEFKEECKVSSLLIPTIALLGSAIILYIVGVILILSIYCI